MIFSFLLFILIFILGMLFLVLCTFLQIIFLSFCTLAFISGIYREIILFFVISMLLTSILTLFSFFSVRFFVKSPAFWINLSSILLTLIQPPFTIRFLVFFLILIALFFFSLFFVEPYT